MVDPSKLQYRPASGPAVSLPLGRYLPPVPPGILPAWLAEHAAPASWLLDPLGASPAVAIEAARAGYRVIVASNNPILTFLTETLAAAPNRADLQSALAELAIARRGEERLDRHLQSLYLTDCVTCGESVPAEAFLWRRGESQPYGRLYRCPHCEPGLERAVEREISPQDLDRLDLPGSDALHRSRALQRVVLSEDEYREDVDQALTSYLPRPLYVLFTIINKLEGLPLPPERLRLLHALLISVLDAGSSLWPHPGGRSRPRQLTIPPQFRENNLWMALEDAAAEWAAWSGQPPVTVTHWPDLPDPNAPGGAIVLFRGRVKTLVPLPDTLAPQALISVFPRPNQAFWTLSALWSGWLWGREAALPLRNVLDRRRYDWNWHTGALHSALAALSRGVPVKTPFFGLLPDLAPGFLNAALIASQAAGFRLEGLALRVEGDLAQAMWRPAGAMVKSGEDDDAAIKVSLRNALRAELLARGEPAPYLTLAAAGIQALARQRLIPESAPGTPGGIPGDLFTRLQTSLARAFSDRGFLRVTPRKGEIILGGSAPSVEGALPPNTIGKPGPAAPDDERSWWWLADADAPEGPPDQPVLAVPALPLSDRIEMEVVRFLSRAPDCSLRELDLALCANFTGLQTPSTELVRAILDSYGEPVAGQAGDMAARWRLRPGDTPAQRKTDLHQLREALSDIGRRLGFSPRVESETLVSWQQANNGPSAPVWRFSLMASSIVSRYVLAAGISAANSSGAADSSGANSSGEPSADGVQRVLVLPGGRARLLAYKLRRDPRLAAALTGWRILKFRHLRYIAARPELDLAAWQALLAEDPLTEEATQLELI